MTVKLARIPDQPDGGPPDADHSLLSFQAEDNSPATAKPAPVRTSTAQRTRILISVVTIVVLSATAIVIAYFFQQPTIPSAAAATDIPPPVAPTGTITFTSEPVGATVVMAGVLRGVTPLKIQIPPGSYDAEMVLGSASRAMHLNVEANGIIGQHIEFAAAAAPIGRLEVTSDPTGARVTIDGAPKGTTPLSVAIATGEHRIVVGVDQTSVQRSVTVSAGATAAVMVTLAPNGSTAGWARIDSPIELQIFENGLLIGATTAARLMLPVGRHDLDLANSALEFRTTVRLDVQAGKTTAVAVQVPNGSLSINALPWADVLVDRRPAGTTPLGSVVVPIGTHEVTWRHPQYGERTRSVIVPAKTPVRLGVDLTK